MVGAKKVAGLRFPKAHAPFHEELHPAQTRQLAGSRYLGTRVVLSKGAMTVFL